jgi:transposase
MLTQETMVDIHASHRQGDSIRKIAKDTGLSRNTVRRYLREPARTPLYGPRPERPSKLDPHKLYLKGRIEAARPYWIPSTVLLRELQVRGYSGSGTILKRYIRQFKVTQSEPVVRFETPPGQQLQIDFTTIRRGKVKLKGFVATLGYSRATFVRFSEFERQQDWLTGIEEALRYFGGVPRELLFDNAKCLMLERDAYGEGSHRWNPKLLAMANDYGFRLRACQPYRAKTKGKVERFNGYLKSSFITPLAATLKQRGQSLDVASANGHIGKWLREVAQQRLHGTTKQKPQHLLERERMSLGALPVPDEQAQLVQPSPRAVPVESLQHPLSLYDQLIGMRL